MNQPGDEQSDFDKVKAELLEKGEAHFRSGRYLEAAEKFSRLHQMSPDSSAPVRLLGLCQLRLGKLDEALLLLSQAFGRAPQDPYAQLHYGMGLLALGRSVEAEAQFRGSDRQLSDDPAPVLNLSAALLAQNRPQGALEAAHQAQLRAPNLPQAWYMIGQANLALGRPLEAESAFSKALKLAPDFADAWVAFGVARYRQNELRQAIAAMRRVLVNDASNIGATGNLAAFLRISGQVDASEDLLRDMLERIPGADEIRLNLAAALLQEDRGEEALALLDGRPVPRDPTVASHWQLQRALALLLLERSDEVHTLLDAMTGIPDEMRAMFDWRKILLARLDKNTNAMRDGARQMEVLLDGSPGLLPETRIMARFDLAKLWSNEKEPDRAFPNWIEGHRILGRFQPFSRRSHKRMLDSMIETFDHKRLNGAPQASNNDATPVFIVGMPRSGTTLTEQILAAHAQVYGAGERRALAETVARMARGTPREAMGQIAALTQSALDAAAEPYLTELRGLDPSADRIVDKMPGNFLYLGIASLLFPKAKFIHCTRDPRDIGLSIFSHRFYGEHGYAHDLADLGWYIGQHDRLMAHWRTALPNPILTVRLADWVEDFDGTLARVLTFLDLPYDPACNNFYEQETRVRTVSRKQVRQPINARGIDRWQPYAEHLRPLIIELEKAGLIT